jgi:hypothetical protein
MGVGPLPEEASVIAEIAAAGFPIEGEYMGWGYYNLNAQALELVARLKTITYLDLFESCDSGEVTDAALASLRGNTSLEMLRLGPGITDAGLCHVKGLTGLRELRLDSAEGITDAGMVYLKALTSLQKLSLQYTCVGDEGVALLSGMTRLKELQREGTRVSDAAVPHLGGLQQLELLTLAGTAISETGAQLLEKALPNCRILLC